MSTRICLDQATLHCTTGTADKLYVVQLIREDDGTFSCMGYNGRRGNALVVQPKVSRGTEFAARTAFNELCHDKRKKYTTPITNPVGYALIGMPASAPIFMGVGAAPAATPVAPPVPAAPPAPIPSMLIPQLARPITLAELETQYLANSAYGMQQKFDGERLTLRLQRGRIIGGNRNGVVTTLSAGIQALCDKLVNASAVFDQEASVLLDCEILLGDRLAIFDMVRYREEDLHEVGFVERYFQLEDLLAPIIARGILPPNSIVLAETVWSEAGKRAMLAKAQAEDWEGLMLRAADGSYEDGARDERLLKCKFWATATCRVLRHNAQRSVVLAIAEDDGSETSVGNTTIPVGTAVPPIGALVEVRYLYAFPGPQGKLVQSTFLRERTEVIALDTRSSLRPPPAERQAA